VSANSDPIVLAQEAIRRASRDQPADDVLRKLFLEKRKKVPHSRGSSKPRATGPGLRSLEVTQAVFNYYRWRGWLDAAKPLHSQILQANELALRFRKAADTFSDEELLSKSLPEWISAEVELTMPLTRAFQTEPRLWLRARKGFGATVVAALGDCTPLGTGPLSDILHYHGAKDLFRTPSFQAGEFQIQDVSSQAVGLFCDPEPGQTWWDACAGEGGKTLHLSELMDNKGLIWATDRSDWRLQKLRTRAARAKVFNYRVAPWNGGPKPPTKTLFDGVLVDAPCSGVGTWHRNPHARWTTTPQDVRELAELQLALLSHTVASLKPGAKLVYSVCTITRSETDAVADAFEQRFPQCRPLPLRNPLDPASPPKPRHCLMPQDLGGNGMFVAAWHRGS
jgi:16S rRNA (cytosine967-C5)-methyltransferase